MEKFKQSAINYEDTLNKAVYTNKLVYHSLNTSNQENEKNNCQRFIWFNPSNSKNVNTRIGQSFLHLRDFPRSNTFNKILKTKKLK